LQRWDHKRNGRGTKGNYKNTNYKTHIDRERAAERERESG